MDIKIIVAAHKPAPMPDGKCYMPLHVGRQGREGIGFEGDDSGDNISAKNPSFCELTGIYWAWKNLRADYVGLAHYRRLFVKGNHMSLKAKWRSVLTDDDWEHALAGVGVIVPKKRHYFIETSRSQYEHAHNPHDLVVAEEVLSELHPEAIGAWHNVMNRTSGHRFNMFVMRRDLFDDYCEFIFSILFAMEKRIDTSDYNAYNGRVFGFIGERLMDVWLETRGVKYAEQNVAFMGKMNWPHKIYEFLKRKAKGGVNFKK